MLYSRYYKVGAPPTTQEDQARIAAERVLAEPTTQEDQLRAIAQKRQEQGELVIDQSESQAESTTEEEAISTEVSGVVAARIAELASDNTMDQLREMAKEYGLSVPPRIKEENLAKMIATHEQGA